MSITDAYYDGETYNLLYKRLTEEDKEYVDKEYVDTNKPVNDFIFQRWKIIINSLPPNYYSQYYSNTTQMDRNNWFKTYLDYPTKDISQMPDVL